MFADPALRRKLLIEAFARTNKGLLGTRIDTQFSGSTAVVVLMVGSKLICANVGDSRAIKGSLLLGGPGSSTEALWKAQTLSTDHKPSLPAEYERIIAANGRIESYKGRVAPHIE